MAFLTILGRGHGSRLRVPDRRTMAFFPFVGAGIGALLAMTWVAATAIWTAPVAAALVVTADLAITGFLHFDGLADSADGLLPPMPRQRRLEVMRQPDVGAFALAVVPAVVLLRWVTIAGDKIDPWSFIAIWAMSRAGMSVMAATLPYARPDGLASAFLDGARAWHAVWVLPAGAGMVVAEGALGAVAAVIAVALLATVGLLARVRIGGFTGDVLGAAAVVAETGALLALAAR